MSTYARAHTHTHTHTHTQVPQATVKASGIRISELKAESPHIGMAPHVVLIFSPLKQLPLWSKMIVFVKTKIPLDG